MKKSPLFHIVMIFFVLAILSCKKEEDITPNIELDCTSNFENHTNAVALQTLLDENTKNGFAGMTVLVDHPTDGLWIGSSGFSNIEESADMGSCQIHHVASIYKTYIATIILQLVEENKLSLSDKLSDYFPADIINRLPNGSTVNIKNLLQHRSGIPDIFEDEFFNDYFANPMQQYTIEELLEYILDKEALSAVDTKFHYSDANFSLLTFVINQIEGDFIQALKDRIFEPLELNDTYFLENGNQVPSGLTDNYWDITGSGILENNTAIQIATATGLRGSEGITASANDLKKFIQALASGELVSNTAQMTEFLPLPDESLGSVVYSAYGMGLMKIQISGEEWFGHLGNQVGSAAIMLYNPNRDITVVALTNTGTFFSGDLQVRFFFQLLNDIEGILF